MKGEPRRFVRGHNQRGAELPEGFVRQMGLGRPIMDGPVEKAALHQWLKRHHPKVGRCERCGTEGKTDYAFLRHPAPYTRDRGDYAELCRSCHFTMDEPIVQRGRILNPQAKGE